MENDNIEPLTAIEKVIVLMVLSFIFGLGYLFITGINDDRESYNERIKALSEMCDQYKKSTILNVPVGCYDYLNIK